MGGISERLERDIRYVIRIAMRSLNVDAKLHYPANKEDVIVDRLYNAIWEYLDEDL